jgi:hypothetical protein
MSKKVRDAQIVVRVAAPLKSELEDAASADDRSVSDYVRKILTDFATSRVLGRANEGTH